MTISPRTRMLRHIPAFLVAAWVALACAHKRAPTLAALCSGGTAAAHLAATIDTTRPPAGPELAAATGSRFELHITFARPSTGAPSARAGCTGTAGSATFTGARPDGVRLATSAAGAATWRIERDTVLLDLNPGVRDNNLFIALPLHGGRGHWGLSTFAGEVAGGRTEILP